jgi:UBX domain-containing protein 1
LKVNLSQKTQTKSLDKNKKTTDSWNGNGAITEAPDPHGVGFEDLVSKAKEGGTAPSDGSAESDVKVTLWANGFQVDDGELRDYKDPANKDFMKDLNEGFVPKELSQKFNRKIGIALSDRRKDKMRLPTPPKYTAFSGAGSSLGGAQQDTPVMAKVNVDASNKPVVDPSKPATVVSLRLCNG